MDLMEDGRLDADSRRDRDNRIKGGRILPVVSAVCVTLFAVCCLLPFVYVFFMSFMSYSEYIANPYKIIPEKFSLTAYKDVFNYPLLLSGYSMTLQVTLLGTLISLILLVMTAYPLSKKHLKGNRFFMGLIIFTMYFDGGIIPSYILVRDIGLLNTPWALILTSCLSAFYLILMRNFITAFVPASLEESAKIDGANDLRILWSIVVPLIKPAIASMIVFTSVGYWNSYFSAIIYMSKREKWPLSLVLRELVMQDITSAQQIDLVMNERAHPFTMKMAAIIIMALPVIAVYPFMQRHFVKGVALGSVKG